MSDPDRPQSKKPHAHCHLRSNYTTHTLLPAAVHRRKENTILFVCVTHTQRNTHQHSHQISPLRHRGRMICFATDQAGALCSKHQHQQPPRGVSMVASLPALQSTHWLTTCRRGKTVGCSESVQPYNQGPVHTTKLSCHPGAVASLGLPTRPPPRPPSTSCSGP